MITGGGMRMQRTDLRLLRAFPAALEADVRTVIDTLPDARHWLAGSFSVSVAGEDLEIPYRIYNAEPLRELKATTELQQRVLDALYTRHHDGFVRQRHLASLLVSSDPWVMPFVVQLIGEYVIEIIETIRSSLPDLDVPGSTMRQAYGSFVSANPAFFERTSSRVISYWNAYYRFRYPDRRDYPGQNLISLLSDAAHDAQIRG